MTIKLLLPAALIAMLTIAGCGQNDTPAETTPAATVAPAAAPAAAVAPAAATATTDATTMTPEQAMQAVQAQAATMTDAQKAETVAAARKAAEEMGKAQGLTAEQIGQAADIAEDATKEMLGIK